MTHLYAQQWVTLHVCLTQATVINWKAWGDCSRTAVDNERLNGTYVNQVILHWIPTCSWWYDCGAMFLKTVPHKSQCLFKQRELCLEWIRAPGK